MARARVFRWTNGRRGQFLGTFEGEPSVSKWAHFMVKEGYYQGSENDLRYTWKCVSDGAQYYVGHIDADDDEFLIDTDWD